MLKVLTDLKKTPAVVKVDLPESERAIVEEILDGGVFLKQVTVPATITEVFYVKNSMLDEYLKLKEPKAKPLNPESSDKSTPN